MRFRVVVPISEVVQWTILAKAAETYPTSGRQVQFRSFRGGFRQFVLFRVILAHSAAGALFLWSHRSVEGFHDQLDLWKVSSTRVIDELLRVREFGIRGIVLRNLLAKIPVFKEWEIAVG